LEARRAAEESALATLEADVADETERREAVHGECAVIKAALDSEHVR
jgi:putative NADH-flavin reductase